MMELIKKYGYCLGLLLVALAGFNTGLKIPPFDADNMLALTLGTRSNPLSFFIGWIASYLPVYRPLPVLTIWLQYRIFGLRTEFFFLFNQLIWISCGMILFSFICKLSSRSRLTAFFAALIFLFDARALASLIWIGERQSTMACLFGLSGLLLALASAPPRWRRPQQFAVFFLLLASALSKEYGLAFAGSLTLFALIKNWKENKGMIIAAIAALAVYGFMRGVFAGGGTANYCESMGFFLSERDVCYHQLDLRERLLQHGYNIFSTFAGTFFPSVFSGGGAVRFTPLWGSLVWELFVFAFCLVGWIKLPKRTLPWLGLIVFNAILSFMLYRVRNQIIGMSGLYISFGIGLAYAMDFLFCLQGKRRIIFPTVGVVIMIVLLWQIKTQLVGFNLKLSQTRQEFASADPCQGYLSFSKDISINVVKEIKNTYHLANPGCDP